MQTIVGRVTFKSGNTSINVEYNVGAVTQLENFNITNAKVYVYDSAMPADRRVSSGDASDIEKYDAAKPQQVFLRIFQGVVQEILVVKQ